MAHKNLPHNPTRVAARIDVLALGITRLKEEGHPEFSIPVPGIALQGRRCAYCAQNGYGRLGRMRDCEPEGRGTHPALQPTSWVPLRKSLFSRLIFLYWKMKELDEMISMFPFSWDIL